jgi:hypothetical protein
MGKMEGHVPDFQDLDCMRERNRKTPTPGELLISEHRAVKCLISGKQAGAPGKA